MTFLKNTSASLRKVFLIAALALALCFGWAGVAHAQTGVKPNLHMVSVGISKYVDIAPLKCAHKDAMDMANLFQAQQGKQFGQVQVTQLIDNQATWANIKNALHGVASKVTADDYVIVYMAGHGGKGPNHPEYSYCAFDTNLGWSEIQQSLAQVPCKVIVILDTCQAGHASGGNNLVVFCGSLAHQGGGEDQSEFGNGYFTKTLIEALKGSADVNHDGIVTMQETEFFVAGKLTQMTGGQQSSTVLPTALPVSNLALAQVGTGTQPLPIAQQPLPSQQPHQRPVLAEAN
jgi:hypothetical protein